MHDCDQDLEKVHHLLSDYKQKGWNLTKVYLSADELIFIYENKTLERDMLLNSARELIVWFGSGLSAWTVFINLILCLTLLLGLIRDSRSSFGGTSRNLSRWLALNFTVVQLLMGAFVIPLNVSTDRHGGWIYGGTMCRVWLMTKLLLVAETMWSMFVVMFDRFLLTVSSLSYIRWCSWKTTLGEIILSWAISTLVLVPTMMSQNDEDFILEEVCATSMSPEHTLFVTLAVFVVPATLIIVIGGAIGLARMRARDHVIINDYETEYIEKIPSMRKSFNADLKEKVNNEYCHLDNGGWSSTGSFSNQDHPIHDYTTNEKGELAAIVTVSLCCVIQWAPFHAISAVIPFCEGFLCINPTIWSLMIWLGYSTAGVAPICWFLDPWIRRYAGLNMCRHSNNRNDVMVSGVITCESARLRHEVGKRDSASSLVQSNYPSLQSASAY